MGSSLCWECQSAPATVSSRFLITWGLCPSCAEWLDGRLGVTVPYPDRVFFARTESPEGDRLRKLLRKFAISGNYSAFRDFVPIPEEKFRRIHEYLRNRLETSHGSDERPGGL